MHICFLCNEYPPGKHGGIGSVTQTLARALVRRGHAVTVVGVYPAGQAGLSKDEGVQVVRVPHAALRGTGFLINGARLRAALWKLHRAAPVDVLEGPESSLALVPRDFPAAKLIRMHGGHHFFAVTLGRQPRAWRSWQEARSFARADQLCAVSHFVGQTTRELLRLGERPIEVLPNPVDVELFQPAPPESAQPGLILFAGTVCEKKGVRQLIEAFPQIAAQVPEARLWLVGRDGCDDTTGGSYTAMLRKLIPPALRERIVFKGPVERATLPPLLAAASVCVYPSHMEALPVAWLEGLAMGKAVVASRSGPGAEVIADGQTGLLCDPQQPASIAEALVRLLQDEPLRRRLGGAARQSAEHNFSLDVLVARNEAFYLRCAREKSPGA
jgi:glycosyltransferase involved in cell wall biosynthesis